MTNDEKAKAYEMALEAARKELGVDRKEWEVVQRVLHNIFPELAESEDERIRTRLSEYFQGFLVGYEDCYKDGGCVKWEGLDVKSILAWLEKQKEQKPLETPSPSVIYTEQGEVLAEQKPAEWSEEDESSIELIRMLILSARNVQSNSSLWKQYDDALAWLDEQKDKNCKMRLTKSESYDHSR